MDIRLVAGSEDNGKSISLNLIKTRFLHNKQPTFDEARLSNQCGWCRHFDFKIGIKSLCTLHNEIRAKIQRQCNFNGRGKYIKGTGKHNWLRPIDRHRYSWFEEIDYNEYNRRIVLLMIREKEHKDKQNKNRSIKRAEIREKRVKERVLRENH